MPTELRIVTPGSLQQRILHYIETEKISKQAFAARAGISGSDLYRMLDSARGISAAMRTRIEAVVDGRLMIQEPLDPTMEKLVVAMVQSAVANGRVNGLVSSIYRAAMDRDNDVTEATTLSLVRALLLSIKDDDLRLRVVMDMMSTVAIPKPSA